MTRLAPAYSKKTTKETLEKQIALHESDIRSIEQKMRNANGAIKQSVASQNRSLAYIKMLERNHLQRRMKRFQALRDACANTLENLQRNDEMCATMHVLDTANLLVKDTIGATDGHLTSLEGINSTMDELNNAHEELQMAMDFTPNGACSEEELKAELDDLFSNATSNHHIASSAELQTDPPREVKVISKREDAPVALTDFPELPVQACAEKQAALPEFPKGPSPVFVLQ
ncbi:hypothetical protein CYMTET_35674 [Cymbomonas tetramitiformis]|uniref:Uncharacterized protein n=1 Tax=Cymbomonas tetramitiformis TaxID=36881 RepID=A0AAE0F8S8_9CHLO|nr:hypothetical protein CYMTET_35674 [Cymbomonas tetramitiformis]|eukprot:gene300-558_t